MTSVMCGDSCRATYVVQSGLCAGSQMRASAINSVVHTFSHSSFRLPALESAEVANPAAPSATACPQSPSPFGSRSLPR